MRDESGPAPPGDGGGPPDELERLRPALAAFFRYHLAAQHRSHLNDLVQDTLLAAWLALSRGGESSDAAVRDLRGFALQTARHKLTDLLRKKYRWREVPLEDVAPELRRHITRIGAAEALEQQQLNARLTRALGRLKPVEREFLYLRYVEELSHHEASRRVGIGADEASRLKYRALAKLRFLLKDEEAHPPTVPVREPC